MSKVIPVEFGLLSWFSLVIFTQSLLWNKIFTAQTFYQQYIRANTLILVYFHLLSQSNYMTHYGFVCYMLVMSMSLWLTSICFSNSWFMKKVTLSILPKKCIIIYILQIQKIHCYVYCILQIDWACCYVVWLSLSVTV